MIDSPKSWVQSSWSWNNSLLSAFRTSPRPAGCLLVEDRLRTRRPLFPAPSLRERRRKTAGHPIRERSMLKYCLPRCCFFAVNTVLLVYWKWTASAFLRFNVNRVLYRELVNRLSQQCHVKTEVCFVKCCNLCDRTEGVVKCSCFKRGIRNTISTLTLFLLQGEEDASQISM